MQNLPSPRRLVPLSRSNQPSGARNWRKTPLKVDKFNDQVNVICAFSPLRKTPTVTGGVFFWFRRARSPQTASWFYPTREVLPTRPLNLFLSRAIPKSAERLTESNRLCNANLTIVAETDRRPKCRVEGSGCDYRNLLMAAMPTADCKECQVF